MKRMWPRNAWGQPRFLPFVTRWLTRRWHRRMVAEIRAGWDVGFNKAAQRLRADEAQEGKP